MAGSPKVVRGHVPTCLWSLGVVWLVNRIGVALRTMIRYRRKIGEVRDYNQLVINSYFEREKVIIFSRVETKARTVIGQG